MFFFSAMILYMKSLMALKRKELGLTQGQLGKMVGCTASMISRVEKRKCPFPDELKEKVAQILGVKIEELSHTKFDVNDYIKLAGLIAEELALFQEKEKLNISPEDLGQITQSAMEFLLEKDPRSWRIDMKGLMAFAYSRNERRR